MRVRLTSRVARAVLALMVAVSMLVVVAPAVGAVETTYYVDPANGSDANSGTSVTQAFKRISYAASVAVAGDTIIALPGTYSATGNGETFPIAVTPGTTIQSADGPEATVIDCEGSARALEVVNATVYTSFYGFTVKDGATIGSGSGVIIRRDTPGSAPGWPLIQDCVFTGCEAADGGAVSVQGISDGLAEPTIVGTEFIDCTAASLGGALYVGAYASATTAESSFFECDADEGGAVAAGAGGDWSSVRDEFEACQALDNAGGAAHAQDADVSIDGSTFLGNQAVQDGGAVWFEGTGGQSLDVTRSRFTGNGAGDDGGAAYVGDGDVNFENCVINDNTCEGGGGAAFFNGGTAEFFNNTVFGNESTAMVGFAGVYFDGPGPFVVSNSIFWDHVDEKDVGGGATIRYSCTASSDAELGGQGVTVGSGMVHGDPKLFDTDAGDFRLEAGSPCIDSARAADAPPKDIEGKTRPLDGDGDGTKADDMGAWERPTAEILRLAGLDRYETAAEVAKDTFDSATIAVIASGQNFPDALSAAGLCGAYQSPLLLTRTDSLPPITSQTLGDLGVTHVIIVGGTGAVSQAVEDVLATDYEIKRIGGIDRYQTSALIAEEVAAVAGDEFTHSAFIARGDLYPDALAVSPYSFADVSPILLVRPTLLPDFTRVALQDLKIEQAFVCGEVGAVSAGVKAAVDATMRTVIGDPNITSDRWGGIDRYATAVAVAEGAVAEGFGAFDYVGIATGMNFPDALSGGVGAGVKSGVVLLTRTEDLPKFTADELALRGPQVLYCDIFGGVGAVTAEVEDAVFGALGW